ncbi:MAG: cytochrome c biogenesis protein ResB [Verrucomicrobia bacterium]|nr:cytochrome c biogenesis protein ResB [Deltaproteobacteria bacterium]
MTTKQHGFLQSLWDFFCSLKLTMFLMISLAILSIIGTIIPQGTLPPEYLATISPAKHQIYKTLGFFDMYHSWWFILLLYLLTVNLVACSIKRLPHIWKIISQPTLVMSSGLEQSLPNKASFKSSDRPELLKEKLTAFLSSEFARPVVTEADGAWHLFAQKTPWCRLSVYFVHLSVIIIFIGAMIGSLFGYKGFVNILEGETVSKFMSRSEQEINLGFSVRCEQFSKTDYPNGAPKEFKSILTVLENGVAVPDYTNVRVIVNDPLTYKGITFYQSSYGNAGNYYFTVSGLDGKNAAPITLDTNTSATLPDGSTMHVIEATDDVSQFVPNLSGPAAQVEIHGPQGGSKKVIIYANHPELNIQNAREQKVGLVLQYKGAQKKMFTGLQVAKDPGVWIVWLGCALMVLGIYGSFLMSHRRVWIRIQSGIVTIGGNASKNPAAFERYFELLAQKLKKQLTGEKH